MSAKLEEMQTGLGELTVAELLTLMENLAGELRHKTTNGQTKTQEPVKGVRIPGLYRPTKEEVQDSIQKLFASANLPVPEKIDLSTLPPLPKTITEYINEEREDSL
jgi:hypothetical protein